MLRQARKIESNLDVITLNLRQQSNFQSNLNLNSDLDGVYSEESATLQVDDS